MSEMICGDCGRYGIRWVGNLLVNPATQCPHCGGRNCQRIDPVIDYEDENEIEAQP